MKTWPWKNIIGAILLILAVQQGFSRSRAVGRADAEAASVERLSNRLDELTEDTVSLSRRLSELDRGRLAQAAQDSAEISGLRTRASEAERELVDLRAGDSVRVAEMDASFEALRVRLRHEDLPALRVVVLAVNARIAGLESQVSVQAEWLEDSQRELSIERRGRVEDQRGRRAADALAVGLRAQLRQTSEISDTQAREIIALRDAVTPGFSLSLKGWWLLPVGIGIGFLVGR